MHFISLIPWVTSGQGKGVPAKEINFPRQKQNYHLYLFDKSWNFSIKHVIYDSIVLQTANMGDGHVFVFVQIKP